MGELRFLLVLAGASAISCVITYITNRLFKKKIAKYVPGALLGVAALYNVWLIKYGTFTSGFEDLARLLLAMILGIGALSGILYSLIMDLRLNNDKRL